MVSLSDFNTVVIILVCGVLGLVNALIINNLYENGILIQEFVSGSITIETLMTLVIVVWLMVGIILAAFKK